MVKSMKTACETTSFQKSCRSGVATLYLLRSPVEKLKIAVVTIAECNLPANLIQSKFY